MKTIRLLLKQKNNEIWNLKPTTKVFEALQIMAEKDIGAMPVMEGTKLIGIFSERDYARKVILMGKASKSIPIQEVMTTDLVVISPDQTVEQALECMTEKHIRHLPVIQGNKLIGFISIGDLVKSIIDEQKVVINKLEQHIIETTGLS